MSLSAKKATPYKPGASSKSKISSSASKAPSADRSNVSSTSRKLSLAQQIAGLVNPTPADFDPEDADNGGYTGIGSSSKYDDADEEGGAPKLMAERSQIRKNFDIEDVSEEYKGKVVSRKSLSAFSDDEEDEAEEDEDEEEAGEDDEEDLDEEMEDEEDEEEEDDGEDEDDEDGEDDEDEENEDGSGRRGMLSDGLDDQQRKVQAQLAALEEEDEEAEAAASSLFKPRGDAAASMSVTSSSAASQYTKSLQMKNQLTWYTQLLNVRIRLQGVLNNANRLPAPTTTTKSSSSSVTNARAQFEDNSEEVKPAFNKAAKEAGKLLEDLLNLQSDLMQQNTIFTQSRKSGTADDDEKEEDENTDMEETSIPRFAGSKRKRGQDDDDDADTAAESVTSGEEALDSYWSYMRSQMDPFFRPIQDALIEKWNQKTQLSAGQLTSLSGSSGQGREARNAAGGLQGLKVINQSILAQIDSVMLDENRLVKRSQLFRNHAADAHLLGRVDKERERASKRLKKSKVPANEIDQLLESEKNEIEEEYDEFIYDDNDYYQQVLSEIISAAGSADATTGTGADSELVSRANAARKKTRKSGAMVDRRASKGRKIRYAVHAKLANFMAPKAAPISTEYVPSAASNSSIGNLGSGFAMDELFLNLFGGQAKE